MSGTGAPNPKDVDARGLSLCVVAASWHEAVMTGLIDGARRAAVQSHVARVEVVRVPGAFELPLAAQSAALAGYDVVVALGVVIRGGTPHFDYVCSAATNGINRVALDTGKPIGFGLLTCDTEEQAVDRAGLPGSAEDKGFEATAAALSIATTLRDLPAPKAHATGFTSG